MAWFDATSASTILAADATISIRAAMELASAGKSVGIFVGINYFSAKLLLLTQWLNDLTAAPAQGAKYISTTIQRYPKIREK